MNKPVNRGKRWLTLFVLALFVCSASLSAPGFSTIAATSVEDMEKQRGSLEKKEKELKQKLASYEKDINAKQQYVDTLQLQIEITRQLLDTYENEIELLNRQMEEKNAAITTLEGKIGDKQAELDDRFEQLRARIRVIAQTGSLSDLQMLFDTSEYVDYLLKDQLVSRIAENDQRLMEEMERELTDIAADKAEVEAIRAALAVQTERVSALKQDADKRKGELDALYATAQKAIKSLENAQTITAAEIKKLQQEQSALDKKIKELLASTKADGKYGGSMYWPVPAVRALSDTFGPRWGTIHRGIDIANGPVRAYGQDIVAAADGTVIYTNTSGYGGGYGSYVIIDHGLDSKGRRITTLYAHQSKVLCKTGDKVTGGKTVIGKVGDTGNVTGPHLHFEVRVDGTAVDPIKNGYVSYK